MSQSIQPPMPVGMVSRARMTISIEPLAILIGAVVLLNLIASTYLTAVWWANFIFIPAVALLACAWWLWSNSTGYWRIMAHLCLSLGAIVGTVASILLLNVMSFGWTLLILVPGLALLGHSIALTRITQAPGLQAWFRTITWGGGVTSLLGLIFLLMRVNLLPMQQLVGSFQWWSVMIILVGGGAIWNAAWLYRREHNQLTPSALVLGGLGVLNCLLGLLEAANILW